MNKYNILTINALSKVKGIILGINDYKVIIHDGIDNVIISDFFYGVEIANGYNLENVYEKAETRLNKLDSDEYNKRMKELLSEKKIDYPVN